MSDTAEWILRLQAGDAAAFEEIFAAYRDPAVRTAYLICGDRSLAEDIAQEAFVRCLLHIHGLKNPSCFRTWFYRILTRCAWEMMQKCRRICQWSEAAESSLPPVRDDYPSDRGCDAALISAINRLGVRQKTALVLHYFSGLSVKEIARATSSPEATVKTRLFAARQRLKKTLKEEGYERF